MKKTIAILLVSVLCSTASYGQLFSKLFRHKASQDTVQTSQFPDSTLFRMPVDESQADTTAILFAEEAAPISAPIDTVRMGLILPLSSGPSRDNNLDFYSGVLAAASVLGEEGTSMILNLYDLSDIYKRVTSSDLEANDLLIGPVSKEEIRVIYTLLPQDKYLISPLDQKVSDLADSLRIIQAPSSTQSQAREMVQWVLDDLLPDDTVIFVQESGKALNAFSSQVLDSLKNWGTPFSQISYNVTQNAARTTEMFLAHASANGITRIILASDDPVFATDVMRNTGILKTMKKEVTLYGQSRIRSYETIDAENLHKADTHLIAAYAIDYEDPAIVSFIQKYRRMFRTEPNSFAFQGYDLTRYFVRICKEYGTLWAKSLSDFSAQGKGFQTDFRFDRKGISGFENKAARHVTYNPDFSITIE